MAEYYVKWDINVDADSPEDAARQCLGIMQDPLSIATCFRVTGPDGKTGVLDIEDPYDPIWMEDYQ